MSGQPAALKHALVSAIVTTRNSARTLEACLESIRRQSYPALELVVVDNFSSDPTPDIARRFADRVLQVGPERSAQRNAGARAASGQFVLILDSDMVLEANVVEACVAAWRRTPSIVWIAETSFGAGYWARCKAFERSLYSHDDIVAAARFFERRLFLDVGGFDESLHAAEDWDISIRAQRLRPLVRAEACIYHDEGRLSLLELMRKKFYYGGSHRAFLAKHGAEAKKRLSPFRASLFGNFGAIVAHPIDGFGLAIMKSCELGAAVLGRVFSRPADLHAAVYASSNSSEQCAPNFGDDGGNEVSQRERDQPKVE